MYSRNTTVGQWRAHGRYIARESAAGDHRGTSVDSGGTDRGLAQILEGWQKAGDARLWKLIVSPEFGDRVSLDDLTCGLMRRMEQDLGTKLEWTAVPHFNTEHPHIHIALRGIRDDGTPLQFDRDYIRSGIRTHAEDLCTRLLGLRSTLDAVEAERREITARQYTSLDRHISRAAAETEVGAAQADAARFTFKLPSPVGWSSPHAIDRAQNVAARLGVLRTMGLVDEIGPNKWSVRRDFGTVLKAMQVAGDRQKTLAAHGALLSDARLQIAVLDQRRLSTVEGRVLAHGEEDSGSAVGRHYMLLEGTDTRVHLIYHTPEVEDARSRGRLQANSFIRLQKQFENGRPFLEITDLGTADRILRDRRYLEDRARAFLRRGFTPRNEGWGGWLGRYQTVLAQAAEGQVRKPKLPTLNGELEH
jgi:type IV secretory pathway VirD2 relaxase